jgi:ABC-type multidrug transport system fused ATPase/permease subunit
MVYHCIGGRRHDRCHSGLFQLLLVWFCTAAKFVLSDYSCFYYRRIQFLCFPVIKDLRVGLFRNLLRQELSMFDSTTVGFLTSRLSSDTSEMSNNLTYVFRFSIESVVRIGGIATYMFLREWRLALAACVAIPIIAVVNRYYGRFLHDNAALVQTALADLNSVAQEVLGSVRTVFAFSNEQYETDRFQDKVNTLYRLNLKQLFLQSVYYMVIATFLVNCVVQAGLLAYGSHLVFIGQMETSALIAFMLYQGQLQGCCQNLFDSFNSLIKSSGAGTSQTLLLLLPITSHFILTHFLQVPRCLHCWIANRTKRVWPSPSGPLRPSCPHRLALRASKYRRRRVVLDPPWWWRPPRDHPRCLSVLAAVVSPCRMCGFATHRALINPCSAVFHLRYNPVRLSHWLDRQDQVCPVHFSFELFPFVNHLLSDSGKSTIFHLLENFYQPQRGRVQLDGVDIHALDRRYLHSVLGIVSQEPVLFAGTIEDNILYGAHALMQALDDAPTAVRPVAESVLAVGRCQRRRGRVAGTSAACARSLRRAHGGGSASGQCSRLHHSAAGRLSH